ncbi:hypothetical protein [Pseudoalteromonas rubra]|uniref:Uncharacterized protein n=1 Tax=Pseudoalteromonas rubra TaxID=43658 RepID=A0A0F4QKZ1_9GAMM|nr:hypothetical protein [Pseudoalteromonas rubra]KJZ07969.1 hypothetical protein TW77_14040 [Pseudoalteromonas rubra]
MEQFPTPEAHQAMLASLEKQVKRGQITQRVADNESLLGTTSDTVHLLLVEFANLVKAISSAQSLEDLKSAAQSSAQLLGTISDKVSAGELQFPYQGKGTEAVLQEIQQRAQGISNILQDPPK